MTTDGMLPSDLDALTKQIDQYGLTAVLTAIAAICHDKATQMVTMTDDKIVPQAVPWHSAAEMIEATIDSTVLWPS